MPYAIAPAAALRTGGGPPARPAGHALAWARACAFALALTAGTPAPGQIVTDGSFGAAGALPGPDYSIDASLGAQSGPNLFHSFTRFDVRAGETATFSGPATVANIVSRITGGAPSSVDGTVRSTIAGASLFLLNPAGILVGPNAAFDVDGALHLSTADLLTFADGTTVPTGQAGAATLSVAPIESFGFLSGQPAQVVLSGAGGTLTPGAPSDRLAPAFGADLTITAGSILMDADRPAVAGGAYTQITSVGGRVVLTAVGSPGEVALDPARGGTASLGGEIRLESAASVRQLGGQGILMRAGTVALGGEAQVSSSGTGVAGAGPVTIVADRVLMRGRSSIVASAFAGLGSEDISVAANESISIVLDAPGANVSQRFLAGIANSGYLGSTGAAGGILLSAPVIEIGGDSPGLSTSSFGTGNAGPVFITGGQRVHIDNLTLITVSTGAGLAGLVSVSAPEVRIANSQLEAGAGLQFLPGLPGSSGAGAYMRVSGQTIEIRNSRLSSASSNAGPAGTIEINGGEVGIRDSEVTTAAFSSGAGGLIGLIADGTLVLERSLVAAGANATGAGGNIGALADTITLSDSDIVTSTAGPAAAGNIVISAETTHLQRSRVASDSGSIDPVTGSRSSTTGAAGRVGVWADDTLRMESSSASSRTVDQGAGSLVWLRAPVMVLTDSAAFTDTYGDGQGGAVLIEGGRLTLERAIVSSNSGGARLADGRLLEAGGGDAGRIEVRLEGALAATGATAGLATATGGAGDSGEIVIEAGEVRLADGAFVASDSFGDGRAGSIEIDAGAALVLRRAAITTQSQRTDGGNVTIVARDQVRLVDGAISTSVAGDGDGGNIVIDPRFILLGGRSLIIASAIGGDGGSIRLSIVGNGAFVPGSESVVSASSEFGVDGSVEIVAPEQDVGGSLRVPDTGYRDPAALARRPCGEALPGRRGSFVVLGDRSPVAFAGAALADVRRDDAHGRGDPASAHASAGHTRVGGVPRAPADAASGQPCGR